MRESNKFIGLPVISLEDSLRVGIVRELVVDPVKKEISGLILEQKGWFKEQKIVPYNKVRNIGEDAITIEKSSSVEKPTNLPEIIDLIKNKTLITGAKVVTEEGINIGNVEEFSIEERTGHIMELEITGTFIEGLMKGTARLSINQVKTIGKEIIIAAEKAEDTLEKTDGGLNKTLLNFKETTSNLLENTLLKTKQVSKNLKDYAKNSLAKKAAKTDSPEEETHQEEISPEEVANPEVTTPGDNDIPS